MGSRSDGLSHYWNFNEGTGTFVYDSCYSNFYTYDADDRVTQAVDGRGDVTTYLYDGYDPRNTSKRQFGQLSGITNGNDVTTYYGYDVRSALNYVDYPDGTTESAVFDGNGNASSRTDRDGNKTSYTFDPANRLTNVTYPASPAQGIFATPNVAFAYDGANRMSTMMDSQQGTGYNANQTDTYWGYDNASRVNEMNTPSEYIDYTYDADGNLKQRTYDGSVNWNYAYDADNEVTQIKTPDTSGNQYTVGATYNADGTAATKTLADGSTVSYSYDAYADPTLIKTSNPYISGPNGTTQAWISYTYDDTGNMTARTDFTGGSGNQTGDQQSAAYEYDGNNELTYENTISTSYPDSPASYPHDFAFSYTYDHNENRLSKDFGPGSNGNSQSDYVENYSYDANNDELTGKGSNTYNYNNDGDLVSVYSGSTEVASYGYDMQNRLVSSADPQTSSGSDSYYYTGIGGRYLMSNSGGNRWQYLDGQGATASVLYDGYFLNNPGEGFYSPSSGAYFDFNADSMGSVVGLFDAGASGQEQEAYAYDAFGSQPNPPFGSLSFAGGYQPQQYGAGAGYRADPDTGLIRCGNRYYDPGTGRFITNDPAKAGANWYAYCGNDPTAMNDPSGLHWVVKNGKNVWVPDPGQPTYQGSGTANGFTPGSTFTPDNGQGYATLGANGWVWSSGVNGSSGSISTVEAAGIGVGGVAIGVGGTVLYYSLKSSFTKTVTVENTQTQAQQLETDASGKQTATQLQTQKTTTTTAEQTNSADTMQSSVDGSSTGAADGAGDAVGTGESVIGGDAAGTVTAAEGAEAGASVAPEVIEGLLGLLLL